MDHYGSLTGNGSYLYLSFPVSDPFRSMPIYWLKIAKSPSFDAHGEILHQRLLFQKKME